MHSLNSNSRHILVVDDEPLVRKSLTEFLSLAGYSVSAVAHGNEALEVLKKYTTDAVITDLRMPEMGGLELLKKIKKGYPQTPVIIITSFGSIETAVEAIKEGAYDYITKPINDSEIKIVIERIIKEKDLVEENVRLKAQLEYDHRVRFFDMVGKDEKMQKIYSLIEAIAETSATVLIHGESGTGKRLIARAIHKFFDKQSNKPFVEVSCGALTETLLESEIFGHVKGAFTGAIRERMGRFELANSGTIFLDEIDAFSPSLQVKLLRVLQEGELERVGDTKTIKVNSRIIAATNQDLQELITQGKFRKDLYYRLNIISIEVPPLRDRASDIPLLAAEFVAKHARNLSKRVEGISEEVENLLVSYPWPGNVRELENVIERAVILTKGTKITPEFLPDNLSKSAYSPKAHVSSGGNGDLNLKDALKYPEKDLILKALNATNWNRNATANMLGINRTTLYKKMSRYHLLTKKTHEKQKA